MDKHVLHQYTLNPNDVGVVVLAMFGNSQGSWISGALNNIGTLVDIGEAIGSAFGDTLSAGGGSPYDDFVASCVHIWQGGSGYIGSLRADFWLDHNGNVNWTAAGVDHVYNNAGINSAGSYSVYLQNGRAQYWPKIMIRPW